MTNEIQFCFCDLKAKNDFEKVLLPREFFSIAFDTFKILFANTAKDFSVVTFWGRYVCFGFLDISDLCSPRVKIRNF